MMKTELSAGGVVVRLVAAGRQVLLIRDMNDTWTFPKGIIEKGERPQDAAKREVSEEAGISELTLIKKLTPIEYFYKRNGLIHKTVQYYLFLSKTRRALTPQKNEGISEAKWAPFDTALKLVGYAKTNIPLLKEALKIISSENYK